MSKTARDVMSGGASDGHDLIGVVSQAELAQELPDDQIGDLVESISASG